MNEKPDTAPESMDTPKTPVTTETVTTPEVVSTPSASPVAKQVPTAEAVAVMKKRMMKWIALAIVVIVIVLGVGAWALVYRMPDQNPGGMRSWLINSFNLPVAVVYTNGSWRTVPLEKYENNIQAATHFFDKQQEYGLSLASRPTLAVLREQEYDREIELEVTKELASKEDITVTDEDIQTYFNENILPQAASEDEIATTLKDLYDWTVEDFKQQVLYPVVLRKKLNDKLTTDAAVDTQAKTTAEDVLAQVQKGEKSFADLAKEYSDDTGSAAQGGSLGSFGKGTMVQEFEDAAFDLQAGQVSGLVKTQYGYHIITTISRDDAAGTVEASHILIAFETVDDRVEALQKEAKIYKMLPAYAEESEDALENPYTNTNAAVTNTNAAVETDENSNTNVAQ